MGRKGTQKYNQANSSSNSKFSSTRQAGSSKQSCPLAQQRTVQCDVKTITLTVVAASKAKTYKLVRRKLQEAADPEADKKPYVISVGKSDIPDDRLEVLADRKGSGTPTTVNGVVTMSFNHSSAEHPEVDLTGPEDSSNLKGSKATNFKLPVYRGRYGVDEKKVKGKAAAFVFDRLWPLNAAPQTYKIAVDTCGVRNAGQVFKGRTIEVVAYPIDQVGFELTIPPFSQRTYYSHETTIKRVDGSTENTLKTETGTSRLESTKEASSESYTSVKKDGQTSYRASETLETEGRKVTENIDSGPSKPLDLADDAAEVPDESKIEFKLMRNGQEDETGLEVRSMVESLRELHKTFLEYWESLQNIVPQVGWKLEFNVSFLSGSLAATWGYRQKDARVFLGWSVDANVDIVSAEGSVSFGVDLGSWVVAKLTGTLEGKVTLGGKIQRDSAKGGAREELSTKGTVTLELTGDAAVGWKSVRIERQAGANLELEISAQINFERAQSPSIEAKGDLKPLTVWYIRKSWFGSESKEQCILSDERNLFETTFPASKP